MSEGYLFSHFIIGLDMGLSAQHTALAAIEQEVLCPGSHGTKCGELRLRLLDRLPLGTSYPEIVGKVKEIIEAVRKQEGGTTSDLVVGITGGRGLLSLMDDEGLSPIAVTITGATGETDTTDRSWSFPRSCPNSQWTSSLGSGRCTKRLPHRLSTNCNTDCNIMVRFFQSLLFMLAGCQQNQHSLDQRNLRSIHSQSHWCHPPVSPRPVSSFRLA